MAITPIYTTDTYLAFLLIRYGYCSLVKGLVK